MAFGHIREPLPLRRLIRCHTETFQIDSFRAIRFARAIMCHAFAIRRHVGQQFASAALSAQPDFGGPILHFEVAGLLCTDAYRLGRVTDCLSFVDPMGAGESVAGCCVVREQAPVLRQRQV